MSTREQWMAAATDQALIDALERAISQRAAINIQGVRMKFTRTMLEKELKRRGVMISKEKI